MARAVTNCPYRCPIDVGGSHHGCRLVGDFLSPNGSTLEPVDGDVCVACCRMFEPTHDDLNAVVASVLYSAAEREIATAGSAGRVAALHQSKALAARSLPLLLPDDDDLPPQDETSCRITLSQLEDRVPRPGKEPGFVTEWAVGVTTAPRRQPTLARCLASLAAAGWTDPHLFIDGDVDVPPPLDRLDATRRTPAVGAWGNTQLALSELLIRRPDANALLVVQDDALFPNAPLREYLGGVIASLWGSGGDDPAISLYCCGDDQTENAGWSPYEDRWKYGAVAIVYSRAAAADLLASPEAAEHVDGGHKAGVDTVIGRWLEASGRTIWRSTPSLVEHVGETSTIWPTSRAVGLRVAGDSLAGRRRGV